MRALHVLPFLSTPLPSSPLQPPLGSLRGYPISLPILQICTEQQPLRKMTGTYENLFHCYTLSTLYLYPSFCIEIITRLSLLTSWSLFFYFPSLILLNVELFLERQDVHKLMLFEEQCTESYLQQKDTLFHATPEERVRAIGFRYCCLCSSRCCHFYSVLFHSVLFCCLFFQLKS